MYLFLKAEIANLYTDKDINLFAQQKATEDGTCKSKDIIIDAFSINLSIFKNPAQTLSKTNKDFRTLKKQWRD